MVRRWGFKDEYDPAVFETCCVLVNFDIQNGLEGSLENKRAKPVAKF
jgi:hypothetical protein